jgi:dual-specificity kinase
MSARVESNLPPSHHNGYSLHQSYQSNTNTGYRSNNTLLNGGGRLGASSYTLPSPSSNTGTLSNSIGVADPPRAGQNTSHSSSKPDSISAAIPATASMSKQPSKKRQRSRERREPDWHKFYEKGLPSEVIVIDDSPTPEQSASVVSNGQASRAVAGGSSRHAAKKRKRDDVGAAYDPVYQVAPHSNNQTPQYNHSASGSTISTDRTTSAIHTTAATSLGSHSSNGQNGYEAAEAQPGQKRKRTATRLQIANEAKRRELESNDAFSDYQPPPRPPIKAPDVQVKQVQDVSTRDILLCRYMLTSF